MPAIIRIPLPGWLALLLAIGKLGFGVEPAGIPPSFLPDSIENFDDGVVNLRSYPGQDAQPDSWRLDSTNTYRSSRFALKLFGNTWKLESINPVRVDAGDVWQVAAYVESLGEIQGFGIVDSAHTLFYAFAGTELLNTDTWVTVYQGAFPSQAWNTFRLPVGQDWLARFGYLPIATAIVFVNDRDTDPRASIYFDEISDITRDLPVPPQVDIWYSLGTVFENAAGSESVAVQFHSRVTDPDSPTHSYFWYFGDSTTSRDSNPSHTYLIQDDHQYSVLLEVEDGTLQWGRAACQVTIDPGPTTFPVRLNFVGDVMLARRYDNPGGLIDTLGVNAIFDPTLPWLGNAADITVANLECPLTTRGTRHPTKEVVLRGRPQNVAGLVHAGFDFVSLANNHTGDYGLIGLRETQESLAANSIGHSGAGANSYEAFRPAFLQKSGLNIAFLTSCNRTGQYDNYQPYLDAGFNKPGFALLDSFHLARQIAAVESTADVVIAVTHSGIEYSTTPPDILSESDQSEDEFYSRQMVEPDLHDIALRHQAIDQGVDLLVNHHPHILQGFEVYHGKVIAHSLGDFAFDLNYSETYPSVILNGKLDETGFYDFSVTPVYIDHYIPIRARGEFGLHILDYLTRRSRDLATWLAVDRDSVTARIILDTLAVTKVVISHTDTLPLALKDGYWTSDPVRLPRMGSLASLTEIAPARTWQYRVGREVVWSGNFEDEGATAWQLNQGDEGFDTLAYRGRRSLKQVRAQASGMITTNLEDRLVCYSDSGDYTLYGHIRTENGRNADLTAKCYSMRTAPSPISSFTLDTPVSGTTDWTFRYRDFVPASGTGFFDLCPNSQGPTSGGTGNAWFDDVGIIDWGGWHTFNSPTRIRAPNDYYWIQIRALTSASIARLSFDEVRLDQGPSGAEDRADLRDIGFHSFQSFPNPARSALAIRYNLTSRTRVALKVYDVLGQEVRTLVDQAQEPGLRTILWDGRDNLSRVLGTGTYFCRLQAGDMGQTRRITLLR